MPNSDDALSALREALRLSPDNVPLRLHLAQTLLGFGRPEEAEKEYRHGLSLVPGDVRFKIGLANAYYQQGKNSAAMVVAEELIKQPDAPGKAHLLYSRLLLRAGDVKRAVRQYKRAVEIDPDATDAELANRLGIRSGGDESPDDTSEVVDGKLRATWQGAAQDEQAEVERPRITFKDVGGMDGLKDEIRIAAFTVYAFHVGRANEAWLDFAQTLGTAYVVGIFLLVWVFNGLAFVKVKR